MKHKQHTIDYHAKIVGECISRKEIFPLRGIYVFCPKSTGSFYEYTTYTADQLRAIATYMDNTDYDDKLKKNRK